MKDANIPKTEVIVELTDDELNAMAGGYAVSVLAYARVGGESLLRDGTRNETLDVNILAGNDTHKMLFNLEWAEKRKALYCWVGSEVAPLSWTT